MLKCVAFVHFMVALQATNSHDKICFTLPMLTYNRHFASSTSSHIVKHKLLNNSFSPSNYCEFSCIVVIFQLTQSLKELSSAKEETSQQLLKEIEVVKELQTVNESLSKQSMNSSETLSVLQQELQALQDTIATLRESVETKDSELKVRSVVSLLPLQM